jgi:hypothetical protein
MLAASFPTLRLPAWTCADRSGPAAEPAFGVSTSGFSGEASQPGTRVPAGALLPNPVRTPLRSVVSGPLPQGRHRASRSAIVGLAPRVLSLIPQVAFSSLNRTTPFSVPPAARILLPFRGHHRASHPGAFQSDRSIRDSPYPFSPSGCDTVRLQRLFGSSRTAGWRTTTLAHSSNCRHSPTVCAPRAP